MGGILAGTIKFMLTKIVTKKVLSKVFVYTAEHLAAKSDNKLDDKVVKEIKTALDD